MTAHTKQDFGREMAAFAKFLQQQSSDENQQNTALLIKFGKFLEMENQGLKKCGKFGHHGHKHWGKHGRFGGHGPHGHGNHFGKHGFGRHGHGFGRHGHGFGGGHGKHGRHGRRHGFGGKHFLWEMANELLSIERDEADLRETVNERNPSPRPEETTTDSQEGNAKCKGHFPRRRGGRFGHHCHGQRGKCNTTNVASTQTEANGNDESGNLDATVENVNIEDSPVE